MLEELYKQEELEVIRAVMKLEDELQELFERNKEAKDFLDKLNKKNKSLKTIRTNEDANFNVYYLYLNTKYNDSVVQGIQNWISILYEIIINAQNIVMLEAILRDVLSLISAIEKEIQNIEEIQGKIKKGLTPAEMVSLEEPALNLPFNKRLARVKYSTSENFVTKKGLLLRKYFLGLMQNALKSASRRKTIVEEYHPEFLEGKGPEEIDKTDTLVEVKKVSGLTDDAYIFVPNHLFDEESNSLSISLDRPVFYLVGSTDQIDHNPVLNFLWLSGLVYVNRQDKDSRKDSVRKMERLLNNKMSVVEYIEGRYNNSENKLLEEMFYSAFELWEKTGKKVVPVSTHTTMDADTVYVCFGKPLDFKGMTKYEARDLIREKIAEMHYEQIRQHSIPLTREYLDSRKDYHLDYMIQRRQEYCHHPWYQDVWDEELTGFIRKDITTPEEVRASLDKVRITPENAHILAPILVQRELDMRYDFRQFMKDTYDKDIRKLYPDNDILDYEYCKKGNARKRDK